MDPGPDIVDEFAAEQDDLHQLLSTLTAAEWALPTPAVGWTVRDQISHLAHTEEAAHDTCVGGPQSLNLDSARYASPEVWTELGCERGRRMIDGPTVLAWWDSAAERDRASLRALDPSARIPWGLGMGRRAFVTARIMEHWAHGLDVRMAVGRPGVDTERLRHVAWICSNALPYALHFAGVDAPEGRALRFELTGPDCVFGPPAAGEGAATDLVAGPAGAWCRLAVQRCTRAEAEAAGLRAEGPLADLALGNARAFL